MVHHHINSLRNHVVTTVLCLLSISCCAAFNLKMNGNTYQARYPTPPRIKSTENWREAAALSQKFQIDGKTEKEPKTVAIIGGGLSGLACAKYLSDAGHKPIVYEARNVLGGKVSAWQDKDGDWIETGLHIFFGAYPNMMNLFEELDIEDRLQWKSHQMTFAMADRPGEFTSFNFPPGVPAPFNMAAAILLNNDMLTLEEKIKMVPGLLPMLLEGQSFIDEQDELSVLQFMKKFGMPDRINEEIFIAMGKALDFIDPDKLSMSVVLTAMNRFINEADGSQTAFLDGNQPDRLCKPIVDHIASKGGEVIMGKPVSSIEVNSEDGSVKCLKFADGSEVEADMYVSAMPVDVVKRLIPAEWSTKPYFLQLDELEGIPVINIQLWFDRKLKAVDGLCFSRSPLLSVYADMSTCCAEYASEDKSMLELVFAPCSPVAGSDKNWIAASDDEIVDATVKELARLFPTEIGPGAPNGGAVLVKQTVVRVPRSVYAATPGRGKFRPSQESPIDNFVMAGDFATQKYLGSMEGAVLSGKLAAEVICDRSVGRKSRGVRDVHDSIKEQSENRREVKTPVGVRGDYPIAFGGGQQGTGGNVYHP
uniref:Amine oxidase n=1 Tax=Ditylum brightwellii TaxID=49249 RepID=A0A6U3UST9_9STRA|mmetsp:Transcript_18009/g.26873  ORF Transcript_18009/g.26873 Transcript_18009/m.26873 type:complete len:592 (+) Transcript_18009:61-1836(+)